MVYWTLAKKTKVLIFFVSLQVNNINTKKTINKDTIDILKHNGYQFGLTIQVYLAFLDSTVTNTIFQSPKIDTYDIPKQANASTNK